MTPIEMLQLPTVLHVLPTFDTGGLGSLGLAMIDAWPVEARHIVVAPKYLKTKPELYETYAARIGPQNIVQLDRHAQEAVPSWINRLQVAIIKLLRARPLDNAIVYNFTDAGLTGQAIRRAGFACEIAAHVGTVLPDCDLTRTIARAPVNLRFVPASAAVDAALWKVAGENTKIAPIVWNGVDLAKYATSNEVNSIDVAGRPSIVFGFSGRMALPPVKDWAMLIEAFRLAAIPGSQLRIAGDGPMLAQLKKLAEGLDVVFPGQLTRGQMVEFLHGLDVFVMAALPIEGFSMALVEAVAAGCMIIGTDVPSVREVFEAGGEPAYLASSARDLAYLMRNFAHQSDEGSAFRRDNFQMCNRLRPRLDAKRMALAYWGIK